MRPDSTVAEAARRMRVADIGDVVVLSAFDGNRPVGMLTDRDIVIRVAAGDKDLSTPVREV